MAPFDGTLRVSVSPKWWRPGMARRISKLHDICRVCRLPVYNWSFLQGVGPVGRVFDNRASDTGLGEQH